MMVNCAKCGFAQPQDQYCASCGVDMIAYRPAEKPFIQRLISNTIVQASLLVVAIVFVFGFVRYQRNSELADRIADIENARSKEITKQSFATSDSSASPNEERAEQNLALEVESQSSEAPPKDAAPFNEIARAGAQALAVSQPGSAGLPSVAIGAPVANDSKETKPNGTDDSAAVGAGGTVTPVSPVSQGAKPTLIRSMAIEIPMSALSELLSDSQPEAFGPLSLYFVNDLDARIKKAQGVEVLESSQDLTLALNKPSDSSLGSRDETSGRFLGFAFRATPLEFLEKESRFQMSLVRSFFASQATPPFSEESLPLPDRIAIARGYGLVILGALTREQISPADEVKLSQPGNIYRVLTHERFKSGQNAFAIVVDLK